MRVRPSPVVYLGFFCYSMDCAWFGEWDFNTLSGYSVFLLLSIVHEGL